MLTRISIGVFFVFVCSLGLQAQVNSPLSSTGIGLAQNEYSARFQALSLSGVALADSFNINYANPSAYSSFSKVNFESALSYTMNGQSLGETESYSHDAWMPFLRYGTPLYKKKLGMAFGMSRSYAKSMDIQDSSAFQMVSFGDTATYVDRRIARGGISKVFIGLGYELLSDDPKRKFSVGINYNYQFGLIEDLRVLHVDTRTTGSPFLDFAFQKEQYVTGGNYDVGMQYAYNYSKNDRIHSIRFGLAGNNQYQLNSILSDSARTGVFIWSRQQIEGTSAIPTSVVSAEVDSNSTIQMPYSLTLGLTYEIKNQENQFDFPEYMISAEYKRIGYSSMGQDGTTFGYNDLDRISLGMSFRPKSKNLAETKKYRIGGFTEFRNFEPMHIGGSFGMMFPLVKPKSSLGKNFSKINVALTLASRKSHIIPEYSELYVNGVFAFTISNKWYVRNKIK